ncbi:MAG: hypothetical protein A2017_06730 [Lentisphaerae bacterium GWF2_44_16]|nr:MAG: hypothetical protein A2017_06730 [Lentisphaerae bacterium GWF2_44_16]
MNKSLTPLIIFFALVILLTVIITNSQSREKIFKFNQSELLPSMELKNLTVRKKPDIDYVFQPSEKKQKIQTELPNFQKMLRDAARDFEDNKFKEAEDKLKTILVFEPDNFKALLLFGSILYNSERYAEAEMIFREQCRINPEDPMVYNNLGSALAKQKKYEEAVSTTLKVLDIDPESPVALLNLAGMYSVSGDTEKSIEFFKRAYDKLGERVLTLSYDPTLDNIRYEPEFQQILEDAEKKRKAAKEEKLRNLIDKPKKNYTPRLNLHNEQN